MSSNVSGLADRPLAIEARGIVKRFDGFTAVDGVDLPSGLGEHIAMRKLGIAIEIIGLFDDAPERLPARLPRKPPAMPPSEV